MNAMTNLFVCVLVVVFTIGNFQMMTAEKCDDDSEQKSSCARAIECQPSCSNPKGANCPRKRQCIIDGCECVEGFVRDDNTKDCILQSQCVRPLKKSFKSDGCGENEQYQDGATTCQPSCDDRNREPCPGSPSLKRCVCKKDFYRGSSSDTSPCMECPITLDSY